MIANLKPYASMKDSGVAWLGMAPTHWKQERAKWLFRKMERPVRLGDEVITCFRDGVVTLRKKRRLRGFTESLKEFGYQGIRRGDLVIHAMDAFAGAIGVSDSDGKGTSVYSVCVPTMECISTEYYAFCIREMARSQWIFALSKGIRERSTDFRFATFASQMMPLPSFPEQTAIARYLDHIGRRINRYVQAKQKLIALLEEQKQAIIQEAVTGRIDVRTGKPYAAYKDSGVEWLGKVPEHWEVRRLKNTANIMMGQSPPSENCSSKPIGLPFLQGCAEFGVESPQPIQYCCSPAKISPQGALLLSVRAPVGKINVADQRYGIGRGLCAILPDSCTDAGFVKRWLNIGSPGLRTASSGSTYDAVSIGDVASLRIALPLLPEQTAIVRFLDEKTSQIDKAITRTQREIELLREYHQRLISDVVTGKLDVRKAAAKLPPEEDDCNPADSSDKIPDHKIPHDGIEPDTNGAML